MFSYLHDVLSVGTTATMTVVLLRDMTKGVTTVTPMALLRGMTKGVTTMTPMVTVALLRGMTKGVSLIMALMVTMLSKEAWRIIVSGTEGEMNCQKVCVYEFGGGEGEVQ